MTLIKMELKRNGKSLLIWSVVIGGMILLCLLLYPELKKEVDSLEEALKNMGGVTAAFGMESLWDFTASTAAVCWESAVSSTARSWELECWRGRSRSTPQNSY